MDAPVPLIICALLAGAAVLLRPAYARTRAAAARWSRSAPTR